MTLESGALFEVASREVGRPAIQVPPPGSTSRAYNVPSRARKPTGEPTFQSSGTFGNMRMPS